MIFVFRCTGRHALRLPEYPSIHRELSRLCRSVVAPPAGPHDEAYRHRVGSRLSDCTVTSPPSQYLPLYPQLLGVYD